MQPKSQAMWALLLSFLWAAAGAYPQDRAADVRSRIDGIIAEAYRTAAAGFPCQVKSRGKPRVLRWEEVDRCLNSAADRVNWDDIGRRLSDIRAAAAQMSEAEFEDALETALDAQALTYDRLFKVSNVNVLLPLTNSLLKYLPSDSLMELPVTDKAGQLVGTFGGTYTYERAGGLATANTYRLTLFQYEDRNGNIQTASDKLLLDSFGVPWESAMTQRGFRLRSDKFVRN